MRTLIYATVQVIVRQAALMMILAVILLLVGCAAQGENTDPDFYDREGTACWRLADMVWCEDGYDSMSEFEPHGLMYQYQSHFHTWMKQSESTDDRGKKVCTWSCVGDSSHIAVTSGYGYCPYPN